MDCGLVILFYLKLVLIIFSFNLIFRLKEKKLLGIDNYILRTSAHDKAQNKLTDFIKKPNGILNLALGLKFFDFKILI